ncbi:MAG: ubiquinone/menaquinone biosynthesis methyltransferase [Desulfovibrio sp.]
MSSVDPTQHGKNVAGMFGRIAKWYDFLNHALSLGQDYYWRYRLVNHIEGPKDLTVLDLAAGTLDVSMEVLRQYPDAKVYAMDFAYPMLHEGAGKKLRNGKENHIFPVQADGKSLPLPDNCVDACTISFGIRNIIPREEAYAEIRRVLKPGGRLCILEFGSGKQKIWNGVYNFYLNKLLPWVGNKISGDDGAYKYLADTINAFPDARELDRELSKAGFGRIFHVPLLSGIVYMHIAEKKSGKRMKTTLTE